MSSEVDVHAVDTQQELDSLVDRLANHSGWLSFDLETRADEGRNLEYWHDSSRIVSVSFSPDSTTSWVVPLSHPHAPWSDQWQTAGRRLFALLPDDVLLVAQNAKFDMEWVLATLGVDLRDHLGWDTMVGSFLLDENQRLGLKTRAVEDVGVEPWGDIDLSDAEQSDWDELCTYNGLDTAHTFRLHQWQRDRLRADQGLGTTAWHTLRPVIGTLARAEVNGMLLDVAEVERRREEAQAERQRLYGELEAGVPKDIKARHMNLADRLFDVEPIDKEQLSWAPTSKFFLEYAERHWPTLETSSNTGKPSWNASVLKRLAKSGHEDASTLMAMRKLDKQLSTYLTRWPDDVDEHGRIHATYKPARVVTGRLSCEKPNLQQVDKKLKTCFISPPGWKFVQVDYSQVEVRIMAHVSGDRNLKAVYLEGRDVYRETGGAIYDTDPESLSDHERFTMKAVVLGFLYGMLPPSFVNYSRDVFGMDITLDQSERFHHGFFNQYPEVAVYHERQRRTVRQDGRVRAPTGRLRRLPEIRSKDKGKQWSAERQAINAPIQACASDLMLRSLAEVDRHVNPDLCRIVGTVHDSMLLEVREDAVDPVLDQVCHIMTQPDLGVYRLALTVPLAVEAEIGQRWGAPDRVFKVEGPVLGTREKAA